MQTPPDTREEGTNTSLMEERPNKHEADIKTEDQGTPLTSLTSRQSLPSDDTVCITEGPSKTGEYQGAVHAESDMRSTLGGDLEDCHDEDADGEYEEDDEYGEVIGVVGR